MLRHYDRLGLLKPASVDPDTGYRTYAARQLPLLHHLRTLRELGFTLEEIRELLDGDLAQEDTLARLRQRCEEQRRVVLEEQARLQRLEHYLRAVERTDTMILTTSIEVRSLPEQHVVSLRDPNLVQVNEAGGLDMTAMWHLLYELLPEALHEPGTTVLWHEKEPEQLPEPELVHPLAEGRRIPPPFRRRTLSGIEQAAILTYHGHYADPEMTQAFSALHRWVEEHGYQVAGPTRQVFRGGEFVDGRQRMIIDLQLPITH